MAKMNLQIDLTAGKTNSAYVETPFCVGKRFLEENGYKVISLEENARCRVNASSGTIVTNCGNWTREGILYVPKRGTFLTKNSPILANAKKATRFHRRGNEFYLTDEQVEESLQDAVEITKTVIPTNRFEESNIATYAFGKSAEDYGDLLRDIGIEYFSIILPPKGIQDRPFATQAWLCGLQDVFRAAIRGDYMYLHCNERVRGLLQRPQKEDKNKTARVRAYSPQDLRDFEKQMSLGAQVDACFAENPQLKEARDFLMENSTNHQETERALIRARIRDAQKEQRRRKAEEFRRRTGDDE